MEIITLHETSRGCGYRKPGADGVGVYLMGGLLEEVCPRLPFPLTVCPCCGAGIKFSRGFTWIDPEKLFAPIIFPYPAYSDLAHINRCPMCRPELAEPKAGLMWVGSKFYTPRQFTREGMERGVRKKIGAIPRGFEVGLHFIYLAHKFAVPDLDDQDAPAKPGVFCVFRPTHVDLVVDVERVEDLPERAVHLKESLGDAARIVRIVRVEDTQKELDL